VPALHDKRDAHTPPRPVLAREAAAVRELASATHDGRPDLGRVERLVPPGAGQAERVFVGIEV
jgi:hypothetical protein